MQLNEMQMYAMHANANANVSAKVDAAQDDDDGLVCNARKGECKDDAKEECQNRNAMWRKGPAGKPNLRDKARKERCSLSPPREQASKKGCEGREANSPIARGCGTLPSWDKVVRRG